MRSFGTRVALLIGIGTHVAGVTGLVAQEAWTVEFVDDGAAPTFRAESQPISVREAMGAILATTDAFRLMTDLTDARLTGCTSTRPDLPDARIQPAEIADRIGSLSLVVFENGQVNFTFRTTTDGTEYAITMGGLGPVLVQVTHVDSGELVLSATGAPLRVIRDKTEMFQCAGAADFTIRLMPPT